MTSGTLPHLQSTLLSVAESAAHLCEADDAVILRVEDDHFSVASHFGSLSRVAVGQAFPIRSDWLCGRAFDERAPVQVRDMVLESCSDFDNATPRNRDVYRSVLTAPMVRDGRAVGVIAIRRREVNPFTVKERELLQSFAERSAIEIEMSRLLSELESKDKALTEALEQETATSEILRVISRSQSDVKPVFETIAANARKLCDGTSGWVVTLAGELMRLAAADSASPVALDSLRQLYPLEPSRGSSTGRAILTRATVHIPDFHTDPEYSLASWADAVGFRSAIAVPMLRDGNPVGAINVVGAKSGMFSEQQIAMLQTFADQAVIAIENTRLFNEVQTRNRDLTEALEQQTATSEILRW